MWLGHLDEFSDYVTQGTSLEDLKAHLADLYAELSLGAIPAGSPTRCPVRTACASIRGRTTHAS
jgi:hypothetical protein